MKTINDLLGFSQSRECFQIGQTHELIYNNRVLEIHMYSGSITIKDLTDAGKVGKKVNVLSFSYWKNNASAFEVLSWDFDEIFNVLIGKVKPEDFSICSDFESIKVYLSTNQANRYLSKDLSVYKPLKEEPKKWTIPHVIRALINGQFENLTCDGKYTDDYAWDNAINFGKGEIKDAVNFAKKIIEHPSGWWCHKSNEVINIDCHSFDNNSFEFVLNNKPVKQPKKSTKEIKGTLYTTTRGRKVNYYLNEETWYNSEGQELNEAQTNWIKRLIDSNILTAA
jgi:hypothetical protein